MDIDQLKLLAGRVRGHLARRGLDVGHNQSLDLSAALPGLRNWPEVMAFPGRVASLQLDYDALDRLARCIERRTGMSCSVDDLQRELAAEAGESLTAVWPSGPRPGVYIARTEAAVRNVIERHDSDTDGDLFYSEELGTDHDSCFDLGEFGLHGNGLRKLPSGTLVIVSRVELTQETWEDARQRIQAACWLAVDFDYRVVVLPKTASEATLMADIRRLVEEQAADHAAVDLKGLRGFVADDGTFVVDEEAFARTPPLIPSQPLDPSTPATVPPNMEHAIRHACSGRPRGIVVLGHLGGKEALAPLLRTAMRYTDYAGPACRVMSDPREMAKHRLPDRRLLEIPVLPSVSAAIAHGYRRIVLEDAYGRMEGVFENAEQALFLVSMRAGEVRDAVTRGFLRAPSDDPAWLQAYAAIIASSEVTIKGEACWMVDGYLRADAPAEMPIGATLDERWDFFVNSRFHRIEDDLRRLAVESGLTKKEFKEAAPAARFIVESTPGLQFARAKSREKRVEGPR